MNYTIRMNEVSNPEKSVKAFVTVTFEDCFKVCNIAVVESREGSLFVSMPSYAVKQTSGNGRTSYQDVCYPTTKEFREKVCKEILTTYRQEKERERTAPAEENVPIEERYYEVEDHELPFR